MGVIGSNPTHSPTGIIGSTGSNSSTSPIPGSSIVDADFVIIGITPKTLSNYRKITAGAGIVLTDGGAKGDLTIAATPSGGGLADPGGNGIVVRTAVGVTTARTIVAGSSKISVGNGSGVAGDPSVDVVEAQLLLQNLGGAVTDAQVPDTISIANLTQVTTRPATALTMATARVLGRSTGGTGAVEEISVGSGLLLSAGVLSATAGGGGTVTSVDLIVPNSTFSISGGPITTSGVFTVLLIDQGANLVFAGPTTGVPDIPDWRSLVAADLPNVGVHTGDATGTFPTITLVNVAGNPFTTVGDATHVAQISTDAKGRVTAITSVAFDTDLVEIAALANVQGDLLYTDATPAWQRLAKDTNATRYLANTGTSNNPAWAQVNLANGVSGTLPILYGGTGQTSATDGDILYGDGGIWNILNKGSTGQMLLSTATTIIWRSMSGDATLTSAGAITLASVSGNPFTTIGDATHVAQVSTDVKGRVTACSSIAIAIPSTAITTPLVDSQIPDDITINGTGNVTWTSVSKIGSSLGDLGTRLDTDLQKLPGANIILGRGNVSGSAIQELAIADSTILFGAGTIGVANLEDLNGVLSVAKGGTGTAMFGGSAPVAGGIPWFNSTTTMLTTSALVDHAVMLGSGVAGPHTISIGTTGSLLLGTTGADPAFAVMSGDATITAAGVVTLNAAGALANYLLLAGRAGTANNPIISTTAEGIITGSSGGSTFGLTLRPQASASLTQLLTFDGLIKLFTSQPSISTAQDLILYNSSYTDSGSGTVRGFAFVPTISITASGGGKISAGIEISPAITYASASSIILPIVYGIRAVPTIVSQRTSVFIPDFRLFSAEAVISSATANGILGTQFIFHNESSFQATNVDLSASAVAAAIFNDNGRLIAVGASGKLTGSLRSLISAPTFSADTAGGVLTVTDRRGAWFKAPSVTATGTVTITDNTLIEIDAQLNTSGNRTVTRNTGIKSALAIGTGGTTTKFINHTGTAPSSFGGLFDTYNGIATVGIGIPSQVATVDLTAQGAAIGAATLYAVPAAGAGMYCISWVATVTRAGTTSTLGGTAGFQCTYTDNDDSVVKTTPAAGVPTVATNQAYSQTNQGNSTATQISGVVIVNAKASTNITYQIGYASTGGTSMQYNLHVRCEWLG